MANLKVKLVICVTHLEITASVYIGGSRYLAGELNSFLS